MPLFDAVQKYILKNKIRFHTPGHSGKAEVLKPFSDVLPFDVTEVGSLDSLYNANGAIYEAENLAAQFFGAKRTLISAGGCTLAIQTMLALTLKSGEKIIVDRNCHHSVINTLALLDINPIYVYPDYRLGGRINPADIEKLLHGNPDTKAVFITSPNYFGVISDIKAISDLTNKYKIPLLVDNAHGTHLIFFGKHPITLGAAMTACSAHKTLPVLTGGAWLNIADEKYAESAKQKMSVFGSTSPSYLIMSSLDLCRDWCEREGRQRFSELSENLSKITELADKMGLKAFHGDIDPVRITLCVENGAEAIKTLRSGGIECEYYDSHYIVFIITPFHSSTDLQRLYDCIKQLKPAENIVFKQWEKPSRLLTPREAIMSDSIAVPTEKAVLRTAAEVVSICPPGIPLIMPGEQITARIAEQLKNSGILNIKVVK